jgi:hypothetical protein
MNPRTALSVVLLAAAIFTSPATMKTISSVQLLDLPGDVLRGEVFH